MKLLALLPYLMIAIGIGLGASGVKPALLGWGACAFGILGGLAAAITILATGQLHHWKLAVFALAPLAVALPIVVKDLTHPRINDVSTDIDNPPVFVTARTAPPNKGRDMTFPEHFGPIIKKSYPLVRPLMLNATPSEAFQRMIELADTQSNWRITSIDRENRSLEAEATTSVLRFIDDIVIRVTPVDETARIDMRSKSREGLVDGGQNAKRIQGFLKQIRNHSTKDPNAPGREAAGER